MLPHMSMTALWHTFGFPSQSLVRPASAERSVRVSPRPGAARAAASGGSATAKASESGGSKIATERQERGRGSCGNTKVIVKSTSFRSRSGPALAQSVKQSHSCETVGDLFRTLPETSAWSVPCFFSSSPKTVQMDISKRTMVSSLVQGQFCL